MVNMDAQFNHRSEADSLETAIAYYGDRLQTLERQWQVIDPEAKCFVSSESLIQDTDQVLRRLQEFLGLSSPLSERYQSFIYTGEPIKGDPSPNISLGKVTRFDAGPAIALSVHQLDDVRRKYDSAMSVMGVTPSSRT